ncbi:histidine triad-like zinc binding protein [Cryptosporidium canis]|uniref:Histidine triad-like zinc binding protein n=1 Tax=Cryptosporidium canis TaxID=195482 RepID=A0A9D5DGG6_9CRYT|nr:histidine triad-like zinc binding protein [Cryptosporidium canis]
MEDSELTIFDRIINGEIPCKKVYEDDLCISFHDINPVAPVHALLIPKVRNGLTRLSKATQAHKEILGHLMTKIPEIAKILNLDDFRVVVNDGEGSCQTVFHLHIHILGGRKFSWPPG